MFTRNITTLDRNLRVALGLALDMWFFSGWLDGGPHRWVVGAACIYLLASASARFCPVYAALGLSPAILPRKTHHGW